MKAPRSLEVRLTEYRDMLLVTAGQIEKLLESLPIAGGGEAHDAAVSLQATVDLHRHTADDLTQIMADEELKKWAITGEVPL